MNYYAQDAKSTFIEQLTVKQIIDCCEINIYIWSSFPVSGTELLKSLQLPE